MPKDRNLVVKGETVLAFDFGLRKIGVAVGNTLTKTTMPLDIIYTKNGDTPGVILKISSKNGNPYR